MRFLSLPLASALALASSPLHAERHQVAAAQGVAELERDLTRERNDPAHFEYLRQIAENYDGPVVIAHDHDAF